MSESARRRPAIVVVDDDPVVLAAVARDLRRGFGERYRIVRASSGEEGLEALGELVRRGDQVALLVADQRMPGLSGTIYGSELNQVWTNLLDNAIDALGGSGTITLRTRREGGCVLGDVADSGPGIPAEARARVFEPFFTTKDVGRGTGLGLDTARRIVEDRHAGSLTLETGDAGTTFHVSLPVQQPVHTETEAPA
jgi:signal transduction histidine kinase